MKRTDPAKRFWAHVSIGESGECWEWNAHRNIKGYGLFADFTPQYGGKTQGAHRWAWIFTRGEIGGGLFVCHKCDNPGCVNPAHLFLGTNSDNQLDSYRKGRRRHLAGARASNARLTPFQVSIIRRVGDSVPSRQLGEVFGVGKSQILRIRRNESWVTE